MVEVDMIQELHECGIMIASFLVCCSTLSFSLIKGQTDRNQNKIYIGMIIVIMASSCAEIVKILLRPFCATYLSAYIITSIVQMVYFIFHSLLAFLLLLYMRFSVGVISRHAPFKEWIHPFAYVPIVIMELLVFSNPFTHWVFSYSREGIFRREPAEVFVYAVNGFFLVLVLATFFANLKNITNRRRNALAFITFILLSGIVIQVVFPDIKSELFAEAIAILGVLMTIEIEDERRDMSTDVYNRSAFVADLAMFLARKFRFSIICIRITNADVLQRLIGESDSDSLIVLVAKYLRSVYRHYYIYRTSPTSFMLYVPENDADAKALATEIANRFEESFSVQDAELFLQSIIMIASVPEDFNTVDDILLMADSPVPIGEKPNILSGNQLNFLVRRAEVESALHRGFNEHNFDVYYQPIYRTQGMSIFSAEALLRLKDSRIGNITPDEFIPVAEQNGMIDQLGDYVMEEVCIFLSSGIPSEMGLECISINLSVLQCMQPDFTIRALTITNKYNVDPGHINFEITESAAATDYSNLNKVLKDLRAHGFLFSLDKYGVGYSNMRSIFDLEFGVVKIDKSILWDAVSGKNGHIILENSVRMLKEMEFSIIAEGVETQEQIDLLEQLDVEYMQGYYFSHPVSKNELLGILRVTELARMEEQRAHAASEAKSGFLASMSHEIRTPINAVLGLDEMILRESKDPKILEYAQNMEGAGRTLLSLVNDILDFSKIESGSMAVDEASYRLSSVINDVINMVQLKAEQKKLKLHVNVDSKLPENLYGDEMRNRQIMVNILNNAIKYTEEGSITLTVGGEKRGKEKLILKIEITDTGIGIRKEDMGKLFRKFQRLDEEKNSKIEGTGLGLAITYNLLQIMHGEIDVKSVYGKGSTFTILLPQQIMSNEEIGDFRSKYRLNNTRHVYRESFKAPTAKILVVDDMPVNHMVVIELLKKTEIIVDTANSGKECLEKVQAASYDVILLDFRMPEMDGIETLQIMRTLPNNHNRKTPVIALTADAVAGAREKFLKEGFDDYVMKPVDGKHLEDLMIRYLPPEKVEMTPEDDFYDEAEEETVSEDDWLQKLGDLDTKIGLQNCGTAESYKKVLQIYYENIAKKSDEIEDFYNKEDWENYTILVHALKSSSRIIGATELSGWAADLEAAGNEQNTDKIYAYTDRLLARYRSYANVLSEIFGCVGEEEEEDDSDLPMISDSMYKDAILTMKDFAKMYDYDNILYVIESLKEYRLPGDGKEKIKKINDQVEELAWEEVIKLLEEM